jgi:DNA-binding CsgD family transcriptional regulator
VRAGIASLAQAVLAGNARIVSSDWASFDKVLVSAQVTKIRLAVACADAATPAATWARMVGVVRDGAVLVVRTPNTPPAQRSLPSIAMGAPVDVWRQAIQSALAASLRKRSPDAAIRDLAVPPMARLTPRQREVLALVSEGMSNSVIAERLDLTVGTVKLHVAAVLRALSLRNRIEVIMQGSGGNPNHGDPIH